MKKSGWLVLVALVVVPLAMTIFPASISTADEKTEILIGVSIALTGPLAGSGHEVKWAYELATREVNQTGGIFVRDAGKKLKIKLIFEDNASNPMKAASTVEKLARIDKVYMLLGGGEPTCVIAGCIAAERHKTYYHTGYGTPIHVWLEHKFKWSTNFFFPADQVAIPFKIADTIEKNMRPKRIAVVTEDTFVGEGLTAELLQMGKAAGYKTIAQIKLPLGAKDYSPQISKVKQAGIDAMLLFAGVDDMENFVRGLKKSNFNVPFIYTWKGGSPGKFWKDMGKDAQYIVCDGFWSMDFPFEGAKELGEKYHAKFNQYSVTVGLPYTVAKILFEAIERAGTLDGAKVRQTVLAHTFKTVMGDVKYSKEGLALFPQIAAQWWDGKQMLIYPSQYAIWTLKLAPAWDKR